MYNRDVAIRADVGVFHRTDAIAAGMSSRQIARRVSAGFWMEVLPGVYRVASTPVTPDLIRRAALLWAGTGAALSHQSAGLILRLDRVVESQPHVTVPSNRNPRTRGVTVHRSDLPADQITIVDGLRVTPVVRTLLDLSDVLSEQDLEAAVESARRRYGTQLAAVRAQLDSRHGAARMRRVLDQLDPSAQCESVLEVKVARLLRASGLPAPVRQYEVTMFGRRYRLDFAWPEFRIALECDGRAFHEFQRDRTRWRQLGAAGWTVLPVTWNDVTRNWPAVLDELRSVFS
jgi:very-short-patch-repair endonuclease